MAHSVLINFDAPTYGWLPIHFKYDRFKLDIGASGVFNDPIKNLYYTLIELNKGKTGEFYCWLEPLTYFLKFEINDNVYTLTISKASDIKDDDKKVIKVIQGDFKHIIKPFINSLIEFSSINYHSSDWPKSIKEDKLKKLAEILKSHD